MLIKINVAMHYHTKDTHGIHDKVPLTHSSQTWCHNTEMIEFQSKFQFSGKGLLI